MEKIYKNFDPKARIILYPGDTFELLNQFPDNSVKLIVTSPPYNLGKEYEKNLKIEDYIAQQKEVINECHRILSDDGSICWQVGNYINQGEIFPLDILLYPVFKEFNLKLRNRIIWRFEHGLHCSKRLSGRYETILWFTKSDDYQFELDPIRIPQKYPAKKYFKGPKAGQYSCNPLGKNPGDVWDIPNVKSNHVEKTIHPCQFPVELIERLILSLTEEDDIVFDPFAGVGTTIVAALLHDRIGAGAELMPEYREIAAERIRKAQLGELKTRPMNKPIYDASESNLSKSPWKPANKNQFKLYSAE
ncbi:MAG: DNA-methyltransferase [Candidatus Kapaibacterium sp.]